MGLSLSFGGHLTHGAPVSFSGKYFRTVPYQLSEKGLLDYDEIEKIALKERPTIIVCGATAYPRTIDFKRFGEIAEKINAYLLADISHIAGLIVGSVHPSPVPYVHIVMTTTHKTLRGPRGAMIMVTEKGLQKDPELGQKIDRSVFPAGIQGGPHEHQIAAIGVALKEAMAPEFKEYGAQIVKNAKVLAEELMNKGIQLTSGGTDNHLMIINLSSYGKGLGVFLEEALDMAAITVNKNTVPQEPSSPFYPSGVRLGTPALTTRGMKEKEMEQIGKWISEIIKEIAKYDLPEDKKEINNYLKKFREEIKQNKKIYEIKNNVVELCKKFPLYPDFDVLK
jgi:glycine hydroxymethyltransferase